MHQFAGYNPRNESQIDFVQTDRNRFATAAEFYAAAIRLLWAGWDSDANTEQYLASALPQQRTSDELASAVADCLQITPVPSFTPDLSGVEFVQSFYDDWNNREFVWCTRTSYWLMCWSTSA